MEINISDLIKNISNYAEVAEFENAADALGELCYSLDMINTDLSVSQQQQIENLAAKVFEATYDNDDIDFLPLIIADLKSYKEGIMVKNIAQKLKKAVWIKNSLS